jgi:hypothetical protein
MIESHNTVSSSFSIAIEDISLILPHRNGENSHHLHHVLTKIPIRENTPIIKNERRSNLIAGDRYRVGPSAYQNG